ncbi:MAG TPA: ABC transporter permease [Thermoanaerobaculia bacterium]|nr:ABC transporter permease [Thermoanaerobaculia bacterium]
MYEILQEVRYGFRRTLGSPFHNFLIVLSLALGIGANTAVFSLANGVLLKPLPYPAPDRLIAVVQSSDGEEGSPASPIDFVGLREQAHSFARLAAWTDARSNVLTPGLEPERVNGAAVSADFFPTLRLRFVLGRGFTSAEDLPGGSKVVVISTSLWQRRFGSDPKVLGARLTLDEELYTVLGVVSSKEAYPKGAEFWSPLALEATGSLGASHWLFIIGRLAPEVSLERAQAEVSTIAHRLDQSRPAGSKSTGFRVYLLRDLMVRDVRPALLLLTAAVGIVLLISCNNVVSILLARLIGQEKELAVRFALGCSMGRLLRLSLIETSFLSLLGGGLGLALSILVTSVLLKFAGDALPRQDEIGIDRSVLLFTLGVSLLTTIIIGCLPLLRRNIARQPARILTAASRSSGGRSPFVLMAGKLATIVEVALAVPALLVAGLLTHSLLKLMAVSPGFQADSTLTVDLSLPERSYGTPVQQSNFYASLLSSVWELPGVKHAGVIFPLPLSGNQYHVRVAAEDRLSEGLESAPGVDVGVISPDLPAAMRISFLQGRGFTDHDVSTAPPVALVSQSLGRLFWPGESPLGKRLVFNAFTSREKIVATVVGVVGDIHQTSIQEGRHLQAYRPIGQGPRPEVSLIVRTASGGAGTSTDLLRKKLKQIDPNLSLDNFGTLATVVASSTRRERFQSLLTSVFAVLALFLTAAGIFGVISYGIAQRRHEIGVRLALGATRLGLQRLLIGRYLKLVLVGCAIGLTLYLSISSALAALLFGISRVDLPTLGFVLALVLFISGLAIALPVQRATAVDPLSALRAE